MFDSNWNPFSRRFNKRAHDDIAYLSQHYPVRTTTDLSEVIVDDVRLPPGYNVSATSVLIEIPVFYPQLPPGVGLSHIYLVSGLRYLSHRVKDLHDTARGRHGMFWSWLCFERIDWDPMSDNLHTLVEMVRTDLIPREPRR